MQNYLDAQNITVASIVIYGLIAAAVYIAMPTILKLSGTKNIKAQALLNTAAVLFFVSIFLPSPLIHHQNTNFVTHFVGGGVFCGLLWLYIKENTGWRLAWALDILALYMLTSGLGVANELLEFTLNGTGLATIPGGDTWWDLFANTSGAVVFWLSHKALSKSVE